MERTHTIPPEISVSDIGLASFLLAKDYSLVRVDGTEKRWEFVFSGVPEEVLFEFYSGGALVDARKVLGAYRDLKGLLFQRERGGRR